MPHIQSPFRYSCPAITEGNVSIQNSTHILDYLEAKHGQLFPSESRELSDKVDKSLSALMFGGLAKWAFSLPFLSAHTFAE